MDNAETPDDNPDGEADPGEEWEGEDSQVGAHILSSGLVDGNGNLDRAPAAAHADELKGTKAPQGVSTILNICLVWIFFVVGLSMEVHVETTKGEAQLDEDEEKVDDGTTDASDHKQEEIAEDQSGQTTPSDNVGAEGDVRHGSLSRITSN